MTTRGNEPSSVDSINGEEENSESIPFDLVIEILKRMPAKSIARFRCVSKLWDSTLQGPNFIESFFTISLSRPKILFTYLKDEKTFFFTAPQPPQHTSSLAAKYQMTFPSSCPSIICRPVRGLVCGVIEQTLKGKRDYVRMICNPSTGQTLTLPRVKESWVWTIRLGYDPVNKQFKVLCMAYSYDNNDSEEHQVLTLEIGEKLSWRTIECDIPYEPTGMDFRQDCFVYDEICIQGICYYFGVLHRDKEDVVICFNIRSEKFKFIRPAQGMIISSGKKLPSSLINYKGKLAMLQLNIVDGIQLWVLKDAEKHEWSNFIYVLPSPWNDIITVKKFYFVGTTNTSEIVLSSNNKSHGFYLLYYNTERNTVRKIEILGMEAFKDHEVYTFLDHVEDVKLMASV